MVDQQRIVFLNGKFVPEAEASLPIFDRGLLFADAVYDGFGILDGQIVDFIYHATVGTIAGENCHPDYIYNRQHVSRYDGID